MVFACPDCGLVMSRMRVASVNGGGEWLCWDCGHRFGIWVDDGELDLGIIPKVGERLDIGVRPEVEHRNDIRIIHEAFAWCAPQNPLYDMARLANPEESTDG